MLDNCLNYMDDDIVIFNIVLYCGLGEFLKKYYYRFYWFVFLDFVLILKLMCVKKFKGRGVILNFIFIFN